jgi:hypothetical protein
VRAAVAIAGQRRAVGGRGEGGGEAEGTLLPEDLGDEPMEGKGGKGGKDSPLKTSFIIGAPNEQLSLEE